MVGRILFFAAAALLVGSVPAYAAPKAKAKPAAAVSKPKTVVAPKAKKAKESEKEKEDEKEREPEKPVEAESQPSDDAKAKSKEEAVKSAGTSAKAAEASSVKVKEDKEGVKTYKFETVEVEGRLKSPQVIYFLRRVRAEFDAGALGHRSFLGELSDTRRSAAFR